MTTVLDRGDRATTSDDRKTTTTFYPNTSTWIVDKPAVEQLYQGFASSVLKQETRYFYDGDTSHQVAPFRGGLTMVQ